MDYVPLLGFLVVVALPVFFVWTARSAAAPPRDCLGCGRTVPAGKPLSPRPDLRLCQTCTDAGIQALYALQVRKGPAPTAGTDPPLAQCHFCGRPPSSPGHVVSLPQAVICSDCLYTCQALFCPEADEYPETRWRRDRDAFLTSMFWVLAMGLLVASSLYDCFGDRG